MRLRSILRLSIIIAALLMAQVSVLAEEAPKTTQQTQRKGSRWNIPLKTLGGKQFWADEAIYGGWRIQRNVLTKHHRLLDDRSIRRAWGSREACEGALEDAKAEGKAVLRSKRLCVLLHGFLRSKDSMKGMKKHLEKAGYEAYSVNYPSTQFDIDTFAAQVTILLTQWQGDFSEIYVVTHSLGGIVARRVLSKDDAPKVKRLVMTGPPNQGAIMADLLLGWWPSQYVTGPAGKELVTGVESSAKSAGIPKCEFGVIAGARGKGKGWNPLIPDDDDGVVGVKSTRLDGMADHIVVRAPHTTIMNHKESVKQALFFFEHGRFDHGSSDKED
jgi:pimeloyl-ACP methyl ester carboxylesterase